MKALWEGGRITRTYLINDGWFRDKGFRSQVRRSESRPEGDSLPAGQPAGASGGERKAGRHP